MINFDVFRHVAFRALRCIKHSGQLLRLFLHLDHIGILHRIGRDIEALAIDQHMAVIDELACREGGDRQLHAIDHRIQAAFQQFHQVFGSVALTAHGFLIIFAELLFADIAVIALQLLLRHQLHAEIGRLLLAALAVLTGAIFAL